MSHCLPRLSIATACYINTYSKLRGSSNANHLRMPFSPYITHITEAHLQQIKTENPYSSVPLHSSTVSWPLQLIKRGYKWEHHYCNWAHSIIQLLSPPPLDDHFAAQENQPSSTACRCFFYAEIICIEEHSCHNQNFFVWTTLLVPRTNSREIYH